MSRKTATLGSLRSNLCNATITTALSAVAQTPSPSTLGMAPCNSLVLQAKFTYGSGGTTVDAYVQTTVDGGVTWFDIANFRFTTSTLSKLSVITMFPSTAFTAGTAPGSAALASNTVLPGILGDQFRVILTTTGTYAGGTTLVVDMIAKG